MSQFGRTEKFILVTALLVFMTMSYFLYDDSLLFTPTQSHKLELIGSVSSSQNDVRRKNFDTFSWLPASNKDQIYENDSIFTGDRSEAILSLAKGATIKLQPNSLVTLNQKSGQMHLDLRYGNLKGELTAGAAMTVKSGNEEFTVGNTDGSAKDNSEIELKKDHSGSVAVKLISGSATLTSKKNKKAKTLAKGQALKIAARPDVIPSEDKAIDSGSSTPEPQQEEEVVEVFQPLAEINLQTADNLNIVRETPDSPLSFEWNSQGDMQEYELEISTSSSFENITTSKRTPLKNIEVTTPLDSGTYFWRLKGLDAQGQVITTSTTRTLSVSEPPKPVVVEPPVVVAPPPIPKPIVKPPPKVPPASPELVNRNIVFKARSEVSRDPASGEAPEMTWNPVLKVKDYVVQIAKEDDFNSAEKIEVTENKALWINYQPGKYYYRVFARGLNGLVSKPSEVGTVEVSVEGVKLSAIEPIQVIGNEPTDKVAPLQWTPTPFAASYIVQLSKDEKFTKPTQLEFTTNKGQVTISEPGKHRVRVKALDQNKKPLTEFSNVETVNYTITAPLNSPKLMEPFNKATIFLQSEAETFIWLEWKTVKGSSSYTLEVSNKEDFSNIIINKTLAKNRFLIKDRIPMGRIFWRVRANAEDTSKSSRWSELREFTLFKNSNGGFGK